MSVAALQGVDECPHCHRAKPTFMRLTDRVVLDLAPIGREGCYRFYAIYGCTTCLGVVLAQSKVTGGGMPPAQLPV
ncbi:MAG: hypothetical protein RLT05_27760, partial [Bauldia litoralis]